MRAAQAPPRSVRRGPAAGGGGRAPSRNQAHPEPPLPPTSSAPSRRMSLVKLEICPVSEDRLSPTCPRDWPSPEPSPPSHDAIAARGPPGFARPCRAAPAAAGQGAASASLLLATAGRGSCSELSTPGSATRPSKPRASSRLLRLSRSSRLVLSRPGSATPPGGSGRCHLNGRHDTPPKHHRERRPGLERRLGGGYGVTGAEDAGMAAWSAA